VGKLWAECGQGRLGDSQPRGSSNASSRAHSVGGKFQHLTPSATTTTGSAASAPSPNSTETAHWKPPAAKPSGTGSTATPTEPCTSSRSCACVVTNPPAIASRDASLKERRKRDRPLSETAAISPARCSMPSTHPGQPPKSLPEHRSNCYQGPNRSNGVFQAPLLAWASHQLVPTDPSSPTQNTSR
jgi:hypothetical protein